MSTSIRKDKPILVYYGPDYFTQVDDTVLCHLSKAFNVIWLYLYESLQAQSMRYNPEKAKEYCNKYGITLEILDPKMRRRNPLNFFYYRALAKKINSYNPDIVFAAEAFPFWTYCYSNIKCENKVLGIHDVLMHSYKFNLSRLWIQFNKDRILKLFNNIFTYSPNQHNLLKKKFNKESTMVGMSIKSFGNSVLAPSPLSFGVDLLFFGIISLYKGLDLLIRAIEELNKEGINNLRLTIAGKGESWEECEKLIRTPELYNLNIRFIKNEELPDLMSSHHFLVLPYRNATQSGPMVTALGYCLPVVAPRFGCFTEVYNDSNAVLYNQGDLKKALIRVAHMSQKEYDIIKKQLVYLKSDYSEENIANNYINAFYKILDDSKK